VRTRRKRSGSRRGYRLQAGRWSACQTCFCPIFSSFHSDI